MSKQETVKCDACGRDLTESGNSIDWRLALLNERIPSAGGPVHDMMIYPKIKQDAYFCDKGCLRTWVEKCCPKVHA